MSFSTTLSLVGSSTVNTSPVTVNIVFGESVSGFIRDDITILNGTVIQLSGSTDTYVATVSPNEQGVEVTVSISAGEVDNAGVTDTNAASNEIAITLNTVKSIPVILHTIPALTSNQIMPCQIDFGRDVTGFTSAGIELNNVTVQSFSGSGQLYDLTLIATAPGDFSFKVLAGVATDLFGNSNAASTQVTSTFARSDIEEISDLFNGSSFAIDGSSMSLSTSTLSNVDLQDIQAVIDIQSLSDCAKNLPQRLLAKIGEKLFAELTSSESGKDLAGKIPKIQSQIQTITSIIETVQARAENPASLAEELLAAKGLSPDALQGKLTTIARQFAGVSGITSIISNISNLDICKMQNFNTFGGPVNAETQTPSYMLPPPVLGVSEPFASTYDSAPKDNYDAAMFQIKEQLETQSTEPQTPERAKMLAIVTGLAMGYHDALGQSSDSSGDTAIRSKYLSDVEAELAKNASWSSTTVSQFKTRTSFLDDLISRNADVIRAFINRDASGPGTLLSVGITTYSGPDKDFTTFLDIKPSQRPPELTAYWTNRGYNITAQTQKLEENGSQTGTLNYSDAYNGAYGKPLVSDKTCASTRVPGGSVIKLVLSDGSIYNPSGKNPSGIFTVTDTGDSDLTYAKPDIFTNTPEKYTGMSSVKVYLVSLGSQTSSQYRLAQSKYA
jgi:hypothetical protein